MEASQPQQNSITGGVIWKTLLSFFFPIAVQKPPANQDICF